MVRGDKEGPEGIVVLQYSGESSRKAGRELMRGFIACYMQYSQPLVDLGGLLGAAIKMADNSVN